MFAVAACRGGPQAPSEEVLEAAPGAQAEPSSSAAEGPDLSREDHDACVAQASHEPFPVFIAPTGTSEFREHFIGRFEELRCCLTPARARALRGETIRILFFPRERDPAEGAVASLDEVFDPGYPRESACIDAVLATWAMPHSPVSDVVRVDDDGRARTSNATLTLGWRL